MRWRFRSSLIRHREFSSGLRPGERFLGFSGQILAVWHKPRQCAQVKSLPVFHAIAMNDH